MDVLLGREAPPFDNGVMTMLEYASACHARASEMTMQIQRMELDGTVKRGDKLYKFRTGELRTACEVFKRSADMGSRRLTEAKMEQEMREHA